MGFEVLFPDNETDDWKVGLVWQHSKAYNENIKAGYSIKQINDMVIKNTNYCDIFLNISKELKKEKVTIVFKDLEGHNQSFLLQ